MNLKIIDDIVRVDDKECFLMTRDLTRLEGLFVGGSGGAAVAGAIKYAQRARQARHEDPRLPAATRGQKYVSKIFNDDWMRENGFLDDEPGLGTVRDICSRAQDRTKVVTATPTRQVRDVIATHEGARHQPAPRRRRAASCAASSPRSISCATS